MREVEQIWTRVQVVLSAAGAALGTYIGGMDGMLITLIVFMAADYITGVICAIIDKKLSSQVGFRGIFKKMLILMLVGMANLLDVNVLQQGSVLRSACVFFYISNEGVSLLENAARIGLPIPEKLKDILAQLHGKGGSGSAAANADPDYGGEDPQSEGK